MSNLLDTEAIITNVDFPGTTSLIEVALCEGYYLYNNDSVDPVYITVKGKKQWVKPNGNSGYMPFERLRFTKIKIECGINPSWQLELFSNG